jgi:hypothetical protein
VRPILLVEVHGNAYDENVRAVLAGHGYDVRRLAHAFHLLATPRG